MPAMWAALSAFLWAVVVPLVVKVLLAVGFSIVVFTGVEAGFTAIKTFIMSQFSGIPVALLQILYLMQLDRGISILLAAMSLNLTMRLSNGALSRVTWNKPL